MAVDKNQRCRLLTPEGLCSAQERHGVDFLPVICRDYPRVRSDGLVHHVSTAALSCPEIARRVLLVPAGGDLYRKSTLAPATNLQGDEFIQYSLTELLDQVMAESKFPVAARIYYLADFLVNLTRLSARGQLNATLLSEGRSKSRKALYDINLRIKEHRLRPDPVQAGIFWRALYELGVKRGVLAFEHVPLPPDDPAGGEAQHRAIYTEILRRRDAARTGHGEHIKQPLARYLHAALMNGGFGWQPVAGNYIANFIYAIIPYALVNLRLWLLDGAPEGIRENSLIESVYRVERALRHSRQIYSLLDANPELLRLDLYHLCLTDL